MGESTSNEGSATTGGNALPNRDPPGESAVAQIARYSGFDWMPHDDKIEMAAVPASAISAAMSTNTMAISRGCSPEAIVQSIWLTLPSHVLNDSQRDTLKNPGALPRG
jgi:hypothetical protein